MLSFLFTQTPLAFLTQSFWRDEAFTFFLAKKNVLEIIVLSAKDFNPPLYPLLLHFWLKIFGPSEISLRSFSFIFFWATLYICFLFLQGIFKLSFRKSLAYLLLFLINPFLLYYAFEARAYTLFAFFATLSYYSYYKRNYRLYFFATVLGLYTHYFMFFVVLSQFVFNTLKVRKSAINKIIFKPLLLFLPWLLFILFQKKNFFASFWIQRVKVGTLLSLLGIIYTGYDGGFKPYADQVILISLAILMLMITLLKMRNKKYVLDNQLLLFLFLWAIAVPLFVILISLLKSIFFPRYFIFSTVGLILLLIYLLEQAKVAIRTLSMILLFAIALNYQTVQMQNYKKRDFRKVVKEVKVLAKKDDLIYVTSELDFFTAKYYFPNGRIYIYNKSYEEIPDFVGKVLISKKDIASSLPFYPKKAFVLKSDGTYNIQALY